MDIELIRKKQLNVTDQRVLDFTKGINQLCKDTGLELLSFDFGEAMIQTPEGKLYFLCRNKGEEQYHIEKEARQALEENE